jgi:general secretion pathway protein G
MTEPDAQGGPPPSPEAPSVAPGRAPSIEEGPVGGAPAGSAHDEEAPAWPASPYRNKLRPAAAAVARTNEDLGERSDPPVVALVGTVALALLLLVVAPRLLSVAAEPFKDRVDEKRHLITEARMAQLDGAIEAFAADYGRYPSKFEGIYVLSSPPPRAGRVDTYLSGPGLPNDGWNRPLLYEIPGPGGLPWALVSLGRDGLPDREAGGDDFVWTPRASRSPE